MIGPNLTAEFDSISCFFCFDENSLILFLNPLEWTFRVSGSKSCINFNGLRLFYEVGKAFDYLLLIYIMLKSKVTVDI